MAKQTYATPTEQRSVTSYPARRGYAPGVVYAPAVSTVQDVIDIHCHAHANQQDALALAKFASQSGMKGILYKTITGGDDPAGEVRRVKQALDQWAQMEGITPIECWAGGLMAFDGNPPSVEWVTRQLDAGVIAIWFPVFNHANTLSKVGGKPIWWDAGAAPSDHTQPLPWDEALRVGHSLTGEDGQLKPVVLEILRVIADRDVAVCFGHATRTEIYQLAEEVSKLGITRGFIDHPFSPFVDLEIDEMAELGSAGLMLNFTYDELSPLLGIDPAKMYEAVRAVGVEHVTLSSDAGEPLFPNSVECMRLIRGYMEAFGLNAQELRTVSVDNPAHIVGLDR